MKQLISGSATQSHRKVGDTSGSQKVSRPILNNSAWRKAQVVTVDVPPANSSRFHLSVDLESKPVKLVFDPQVELLATIKSK